MPREKLHRELNLELKSKYFGPKDIEPEDTIVLLHEEIEAIQLMSLLNMYQEDAAKQMNVSRTTFTRIIKNARKKIAMSLIYGYNIKIHEVKNDFYIAVCSSDKKELQSINYRQKYIFILHLQNYKVTTNIVLENPCYNSNIQPIDVLPKLLKENDINYFITDAIDTSFKNSLIEKGIYPIIKESVTLDKISDIFK